MAIEDSQGYRTAPTPRGQPPERFAALTGLRCVAAYLVYFHHYPNLGFELSPVATSVLKQGYVGVSVFYVLSGFLIYYNYARRLQFNRKWLGTYFRNRVARIYPVYFLSLALTYAAAGRIPGTWFYDVTLLKGFSETLKFNGVPQAWSLCVEECFYAAFPLLLWGIRRRPINAVLSCAAIYATGAILTVAGSHWALNGFFASWQFTGGYTFFGRAAEFFCGIFAAHCLLEDKARGALRLPLGWLGLGLCVATSTWLGRYVLSDQMPEFALWTPLGLAVNNLLFPVGVGVLIVGLAKQRSSLQQILAIWPMQILGRASYAFYLIQIGPIYSHVVDSVGHQRPWTVFWVLNFIAVALFSCFEAPLNVRLRGKRQSSK